MIKHKLVLRFPASLVEQPLIYRLVKDYDLMVNILRADINPRKEGRLVMEVSGREENTNRRCNGYAIRAYGLQTYSNR